ncbi:MAG: 3-hydroxyacyl-CoA dehydrogenase NAD-binding domain-containing protein [Gaiellaceae bacterium]
MLPDNGKPVTQFKLRRLTTRVGSIALVTIDNGADWRKPNTFGREALESLRAVLDELQSGDWDGLLLTGKPLVFAAGADIDEFPGMTTERTREAGRVGHELFGAIRELPFPTVAAINGAALGGGLEIALHCDYRTISSTVRHVALPEVSLGIIPGWGGTQLVPRLIGATRAVELIVSNPLRQNRMLTGPKAFELGLADALLEPVEFVDESLTFLLARIDEQAPKPERAADLSDAAEVCRRARFQVDDQVHGATPAPYRALDLIEGAATWTLEQGYRAEEDALADLLPRPQAQASIYAFDVVERRAKRGPAKLDAEPARVTKVGIVGAGLMARQIGLLVLQRLEVPLVLRDLTQDQVDDAIDWIRGELQKLVAKGLLAEPKARFLASLVSGRTSYDVFAGCDLVLEAVFEEIEVKREVFAALEAVVGPECVLATNTSSLSVAEMGAELAHPERVVGMHFFNPVALLPLVEMIRTPRTDDRTIATAWAVTTGLKKRGVLVRDAPAFVVNRILTRMTTVLMAGLERGNSVEETDESVLRLGLPMAPSVLLGMVGPRVANHVLETLHTAYPARFPLSATLASLAAGDDKVVVSEHARQTVEQLTTAVLEALADEIRYVLEEGVVDSAADVDACLILGAGFPFFLGGLTKHLDQTGVSQRITGQLLAETHASAN